MTHGSLFSGIGGFDLAAHWMGWENIFHCEWNEFAQKVLKHHFPESISYNDITKTDFTIHRGRIDVLTGGFPCQPFSVAGKRKGTDDNRYLWPEMLRAIREIRPRYVVGENVRGLVNWSGGLVFDTVCADLETEGYEVLPFILPACGVNAPHRRDRIWFIAKNTGWSGDEREEKPSTGEFWDACSGNNERLRPDDGETAPNTNGKRHEECNLAAVTDKSQRQLRKENITGQPGSWQDFPTQSPVYGRDDGLPGELDGITFSKWRNESIKAYGNAIVPQVAYPIFKTIELL